MSLRPNYLLQESRYPAAFEFPGLLSSDMTSHKTGPATTENEWSGPRDMHRNNTENGLMWPPISVDHDDYGNFYRARDTSSSPRQRQGLCCSDYNLPKPFEQESSQCIATGVSSKNNQSSVPVLSSWQIS